MIYPPRCLACGYVLLGLPAGRCPECGSPFDPDNSSTFSTKPLYVWWQYWLPGFLLASIGGALLFVLLLVISGWGIAVTIAAPIAVGAALGYGCRVGPMLRVVFSILALAGIVILLFTVGFTGIFCGLVLATVTMIPVLIGALVGAALRARLKNSQFEQRWYLPILILYISVLLFGCIERLMHRPYAIESVVTQIDVPAPVGRAWNAAMFYEEVHDRPPWLLRLGLPKPLYCRGSTAHVGDTKTCVYTKGHLTKRITERLPERRLTFDVIEQDHIENHSVRLTDGSFEFTAAGPAQTTVALTTRYEPKLGPRWIWRPAEELAIHTMHRFVLKGMAEKAAEP